MDNTHGRPFEPNHVIPIVHKPAHPDEMKQQMSQEPPTKKRKVKDEGKFSKLHCEKVDYINVTNLLSVLGCQQD
jgi:hypothetical protein